MIKKCLICKRILKKFQVKFCSRYCSAKSRKGKKRPTFSKEWRENIGKAHKGLGMLGKHHSEKSKRIISIKKTGYPKSKNAYSFPKGEKHPCWIGKTITKLGYVLIYSPKHPFRESHNYVRRSRLIIEKKIGRFLKPKEVVHHINEIRDDDRPENLMLFSGTGKHLKYHALIRKSAQYHKQKLPHLK